MFAAPSAEEVREVMFERVGILLHIASVKIGDEVLLQMGWRCFIKKHIIRSWNIFV